MTKKELIKRLETTCLGLDPIDPLRLLVDDVIEALAQPEQEPVVGITAIRTWFKDGRVVTQTLCNSWVDTTPPKRTWVGLTPQQRDEINERVYGAVPHHVVFHHAIEARLKELNT